MTSFSIRLNPMQISQLPAFLNIRGRIHDSCKDVYFLEWLGLPESPDTLVKTLSSACARTGNHCIVCIGAHMLPPSEQAAQFTPLAQRLLAGDTDILLPKVSALLSPVQLYTALHKSLDKTELPNRQEQAAQLLCILDTILPLLFPVSSDVFPKCIWIGEPDVSVRLVCSVLLDLGCDIAVLRPAGTHPLFPQAAAIKGLPSSPDCAQTLLHRLSPSIPTVSSAPQTSISSERQILHIPQHPRRHSASVSRSEKTIPTLSVKPPVSSLSVKASASTARSPLDYETLAGFASSVVMLEVLDAHGNPKSSGSGVLLAPGGIILTNFHVVAGGDTYAVHLENSNAVFTTNELLKYHPDFDLALLRLPDCNGNPIPLYQGSDLARGQSVFAIGSPLGLFNSVSDGIISGFRQFEHTKMIQFTAPAAPGSSGGALLDRYGFLIGIVTSGFTEGQNLNLAVSYEIIRQFAHGFLPQ